jgi:hypothetical protein
MYWLFMVPRRNVQKKSTVVTAVDELMNSDEFVMKYFERRYTISEPDEQVCSGASLATLSDGSR